jgi:hypothetical protein
MLWKRRIDKAGQNSWKLLNEGGILNRVENEVLPLAELVILKVNGIDDDPLFFSTDFSYPDQTFEGYVGGIANDTDLRETSKLNSFQRRIQCGF